MKSNEKVDRELLSSILQDLEAATKSAAESIERFHKIIEKISQNIEEIFQLLFPVEEELQWVIVDDPPEFDSPVPQISGRWFEAHFGFNEQRMDQGLEMSPRTWLEVRS